MGVCTLRVQFHVSEVAVPRASKEQVDKAVSLIRNIVLKDFSVTAIPDPGTRCLDYDVIFSHSNM